MIIKRIRRGIVAGILLSISLLSSNKVIAQESPIVSTGLSIGTTGFNFDNVDVTGVVATKYQNLAISLDIVNVSFTELKNGGYYRQTFKNGQSRCRSSSTGRFASNGSCSGSTTTEFSFLNQVDLTYAIPISQNDSSILLGAAVNFAEPSPTYGVIGYTQKNAYLKAFLGNNSINLRLGAFFN
jgi:hypothetical protein